MALKIRSIGVVCSALACAIALSAGAVTAQSTSNEPQVALPPSLMTAAAAFEHYTRSAQAISAGFTSGPSVAQALVAGSSYEPHQFETGMVAYAALAALHDAGFVEAVRAAGGEDGRRLAAQLAENPYGVLRLEGADRAAVAAATALSARGSPLADAGYTVKQAAYTVQHSAWSKANIAEPAARLARIKAVSAQPIAPSAEDVVRMLQASGSQPAVLTQVSTGGGAPSPVIVRALALAAEAVLGEATDDPQVLAAFTDEPQQASCLKMAKLNLYQCLAVAGPHYEDIFCLGQHAMIDTGQCVTKAAGLRPGAAQIAAAPPAGAVPVATTVATNAPPSGPQPYSTMALAPAPTGALPASLATTVLGPSSAAAGLGAVSQGPRP